MSYINIDRSNKDTMLLTIVLPPPTSSQPPQFCAAMICFPQGTPRLVLKQLQNKAILQSLTDCLGDRGGDLEGVIREMSDSGCPDVEIFPMETVGYYDLGVCSTEH